MKAYKIYTESEYGFEEDVSYSNNYNKAIQKFNNLVRQTISEVTLIDKEDFSDEIQYFKEYESNCEIICRSYPVLIYKRNDKIIAVIMYWNLTNYEYQEHDICSHNVILEEINIEE